MINYRQVKNLQSGSPRTNAWEPPPKIKRLLKAGYAQIVTDQKTGQILSATVVGHEASNLIAEMTLAIEELLPSWEEFFNFVKMRFI